MIDDSSLLHAQDYNRKKLNSGQLSVFFRQIRLRHPEQEVTFLCIGTDCSTGDALGPLVGTRLEELGFSNVVGTLAFPCDAANLELRMSDIPEDHLIVAIDACLGLRSSVGNYLVSDQPLFPGRSVGKTLPGVGHYSVEAVVNMNGPKPYWTLQMTSLYHVMQMANRLADAIHSGFRTDEDRINTRDLDEP